MITVIYTSPGDGYFWFSHLSLWKIRLRMGLIISSKYQQKNMRAAGLQACFCDSKIGVIKDTKMLIEGYNFK